jgi:hypothetical protein
MNRLTNVLTNVPWLARHAAVFAAGVALIAATNVANARGSGGNASHSSHSFSAMPMKQGKSYQGSSATGKKHAGKKHEGKKHEGKKHEGEAHEGKDHNGSREGKNGCRKNCEGGGKDSSSSPTAPARFCTDCLSSRERNARRPRPFRAAF